MRQSGTMSSIHAITISVKVLTFIATAQTARKIEPDTHRATHSPYHVWYLADRSNVFLWQGYEVFQSPQAFPANRAVVQILPASFQSNILQLIAIRSSCIKHKNMEGLPLHIVYIAVYTNQTQIFRSVEGVRTQK